MAEAAALGALPQWDLSDLYPAPDSKDLAQDLNRMATDAAAFEQNYKGRWFALLQTGIFSLIFASDSQKHKDLWKIPE